MSLKLHNLTWPEVAEFVERGVGGALLPVGATEQHGPHLGCGVDTEIASQLADAAITKDWLLLPALPYGCSIGHSHRWPGTLALQPKTLIDLVTDLGDWVFAMGLRRLVLLNAHVTNFAPLRCALEILRARHDGFMVALVNTAEITEEVHATHCADGDDWHANCAETALLMKLNPAMVRKEKIDAADDPDRTGGCLFAHPVNRTSLNGVTGKPSDASPEKGAQLFELMTEGLELKLQQAATEESPLPHGYHSRV